MLIILVVEGLEYALKVAALLDCNGLQFIIASNGHAKVIADRAKIYYFKFAVELLFKRVNGGFAANDFNIIYIDWYNKAVYRGKRGVLGYKNTVVGLKFLKIKAYKEVVNNFILYIRWLFKTVETFKEAADLFRFAKAVRVFDIYIFNNLTIKKCYFDVYLIDFKIVISS